MVACCTSHLVLCLAGRVRGQVAVFGSGSEKPSLFFRTIASVDTTFCIPGAPR